MTYITYTQYIVNSINLEEGYEIVTFTLRVEGTGYILVKHNKKYYQRCFTYEEMKKPAKYWIDNLPDMIYEYFNNLKNEN